MKKSLLLFLFFSIVVSGLIAQPERVGQNGAAQLLINSMPRSSGFNGLNIASSDGIESGMVNPAGIAETSGTELLFANTQWLMGAEVQINSFGFSQSLGVNGGVFGLSVNAFSLGEFVRTTVDQPNGELGSFKPTFLNIGLHYAKKFTDRILVGFTARIVSETTPEISSSAMAFDAGIQYRSGVKDRLKLGIALRNVGPSTQFSGGGLTSRVLFDPNNSYTTTIVLPTAKYELPAILSMGISYDFFLGDANTITLLGGFTSNSFYFDQFGLGLSYKYKQWVILRASFLYEKGIFGKSIGVDGRFSAFTGPAFGATFQIPFRSNKLDDDGNPIFSTLSFDVSYRTSNPFSGTMVIGARLNI